MGTSCSHLFSLLINAPFQSVHDSYQNGNMETYLYVFTPLYIFSSSESAKNFGA